ncbi:MAG: hypothetical protein JST47_04980 [Bacteroidetes bacterium]|nr:hypothetical protein [Bacteroidota bacterium]MBS1975235.1 hypothetical protein [Bacteroidota bacterium]
MRKTKTLGKLIFPVALLFCFGVRLKAQRPLPQLRKNSVKEVIAAMTLEEKAKQQKENFIQEFMNPSPPIPEFALQR